MMVHLAAGAATAAASAVLAVLLTFKVSQLMVIANVSLITAPINEPILKFVVGTLTFVVAEIALFYFAEFVLIFGFIELTRFFSVIVHTFEVRLHEDEQRPAPEHKSLKERWLDWWHDVRRKPVLAVI